MQGIYKIETWHLPPGHVSKNEAILGGFVVVDGLVGELAGT